MGLNLCMIVSCLKEGLQIFSIGGSAYWMGALSTATAKEVFNICKYVI